MVRFLSAVGEVKLEKPSENPASGILQNECLLAIRIGLGGGFS